MNNPQKYSKKEKRFVCLKNDMKLKNFTKITSHHMYELTNMYTLSYIYVKNVYINKEKIKKYEKQVMTDQSIPMFVKLQVLKLMRLQVKLDYLLKYRLIIPQKYRTVSGGKLSVKGIGDRIFYLDDDLYIKHMLFDSRTLFIDVARKSKNKTIFILSNTSK